MPSNEISTHCPHCAQLNSHTIAPLPSLAIVHGGLPAAVASPIDAGRKSARLQLVCSVCEKSWSAVVIGDDQLQQLQRAAQSLDDAKRQIAMLRLIMSKDQLERAEKSGQDVIKLRDAA